jgi:hypothetical protein
MYMTENLAFDLETLFEELVEQGVMEGVDTREGYAELVDDAIEDRRRVGEIHDDQNTETYRSILTARYSEYEERLKSGG